MLFLKDWLNGVSRWLSSNGAAFVTEGVLTPLGFQQLASLGSATALTPPAGARVALIQVDNTAVRWRDDGTNPTSSVGIKVGADQDLVYTGDLAAIRFIQTAAGAAINVSYYR